MRLNRRSLNKAKLLGAEFDAKRELLACTFNPIVNDENGNILTNTRIQLIYRNVNRIITHLRNNYWVNNAKKPESFFITKGTINLCCCSV